MSYEKECKCKKCIDLCLYRPCWGTPEEIKIIIDSGFGRKLMIDYWVGDNDTTYLLSPAIVGRERRQAPFIPCGPCVFLTEDNLCEIHHIKPHEGKYGYGCDKEDSKLLSHEEVAKTWDNEFGQKLIEQWKEKY